jgi:excisionase family DNA binding protein
MEKLTITIAQFAEMTGCSRNLTYSLARKNQLPVPVIFIGPRRMVVSRAAVMALLADRKVAGKEG